MERDCNCSRLGLYLHEQTENVPVIHLFSTSFSAFVTWLYLKPNRCLAFKAASILSILALLPVSSCLQATNGWTMGVLISSGPYLLPGSDSF